jgi:type IV pilus assembly protein PilE
MQPKAYGFTLLELMIVVVIIAILSTLTVSIYSNVVAKSHYDKAQSQLGNLALAMQNHFYINKRYIDLIDDAKWTETNDRYTFAITIPNAQSEFVITATLKPEFNGPRGMPTCTPITINSLGARLPIECWK